MCETFPPNQQEDCNIPRASIKVGWENRLQSIWRRFSRELRSMRHNPGIGIMH